MSTSHCIVSFLVISTLTLVASCSARQPQWCQVRIEDISDDVWYLNGICAHDCNLIGLQSNLTRGGDGKESKVFALYQCDRTNRLNKLHLAYEPIGTSVVLVASDHELLTRTYAIAEEGKPHVFYLHRIPSDVSTRLGEYTELDGVSNPQYAVQYDQGILYLVVSEDSNVYCYQIAGEAPKRIRELKDVACSASGFINGVQTFVAVSIKNEAYRFDAVNASFSRVADLDWLSAAIKLNSQPTRRTTSSRLAFAENIAALVTHDVVVLFDSEGNTRRIKGTKRNCLCGEW